jgi:hypothetical protein
MLDETPVIFAENVAIVQSQDSNSLVLPTITVKDFLNFTGDARKTVQLQGLPSEAVDESPWPHIRSLFGAWVETGDEDMQLEELYKSRLVPSSMPDEDE